MTALTRLTATLPLLFLGGCMTVEPPPRPNVPHKAEPKTVVNLEPSVSTTAAADPTASYVAGIFSRTKGDGFAFVLVNRATKAQYYLTLGENTLEPTAAKDQVVAFKVPPGSYAVTEWFTYNHITKERSRKHSVSEPKLRRPFEISAGGIVFLGTFSTYSSGSSASLRWTIEPIYQHTSRLIKEFSVKYPLLRDLPYSCLICLPAEIQPTVTPESEKQLLLNRQFASTRLWACLRRAPDYPPAAQRLELEGLAVVGITIAADGKPLQPTLVQSSGAGLLDRAAIDHATRCIDQNPTSASELLPTGTFRLPLRFLLLSTMTTS
jgi:TonB family protein